MIDEEKGGNFTSDKTSLLLTQDRLSLYHLQKKHENLQQQQQREKKNNLVDFEGISLSFSQANHTDVVSNNLEVDYTRSSSSTSTIYSDNSSITSSTLTPSSVSSICSIKSSNPSGIYTTNTCDINNNEKQQTPSRKEHYQRVLSPKKMKHSKAIQSKVSSKLVTKRKLQSENLLVPRQQFLDDVSLGLLRFYRAATKVTVNRNQKSANLSNDNNNILSNNNQTRQEKDQKKVDETSMKMKKEDDTLEGEIFYSMSPEEFLPYFTQETKFQTRKSSAPIIKIQNTSPDASSSQESIPAVPAVGNVCPYFDSGLNGRCTENDHSYCPECDENNKYQPCCDGVDCYRSSQYSEVNNLLNNLNRLTSCNCDECHQLWFDGSVVSSNLQSHHRIHQLNTNSSISAKAIQEPMTDEQVIMELRRRSRHRGHQIVGYRRKLMQQTAEINKIRLDHKKQLDDIASQLLLFEASLTSRQKALADTLNHKDQVIIKQQKVIRHLLQKKGAAIDPKVLERLVNSMNASQADTGDVLVSDTSIQIHKINNANSNKGKMVVDSNTTSRQKRLLQQNWSSIKSDPDFQAATDSDSAIMLEDHIAEISMSVPNLGDIQSPCSIKVSSCDPDYENVVIPGGVKVIRSVSDVIALNIEKVDSNCKDYLSLEANTSNNGTPKIYTSEHQNRRNSGESSAAHKTRQNRLLLLKKRHSGFHLRRPEILETVYSVEEDTTEGGQQVQLSAITGSNLKDSALDTPPESYSAPPSATISMVSTTATLTTGVIPLTTSTNITLTGFRWTEPHSKDKKRVASEHVTSNHVGSLLPQSPSIVSRIKQLYCQQESSRREDEDRRSSLISNEKCDLRDESAGKSYVYSSSDDTQSIATTTSATGSRRSSYGSRRSSYGVAGISSGPFMCSMNDLDWRRDSLTNHTEDGANGSGCGNDNLICQCFQCAAVNATKVKEASIRKGYENAASLDTSNRITCGRVCASAPTSRRASGELLKKSMMTTGGNVFPPKVSNQNCDDLIQNPQPTSSCTPEGIGGSNNRNKSANAVNALDSLCSKRDDNIKQEINTFESLTKSAGSTQYQEKNDSHSISSITINDEPNKEKLSTEGLKTKLLITNDEEKQMLSYPKTTSDSSTNIKENKNHSKCIIQINETHNTASTSVHNNVSHGLPDTIVDSQPNNHFSKIKIGGDVGVESQLSSNTHREPTKPKDVKFKRISKAKSRSLEELRDQLRWQQILSEDEVCDDQEIIEEQFFDKTDIEVEGIISNKTRNRLTALREYLKQYGGMVGINQRSLDSHLQFPPSLDDTTDVTCNEDRLNHVD